MFNQKMDDLEHRDLEGVGSDHQQTLTGLIAAYTETTRGKRSVEPVRQAAFRCIFDIVGTMAAGIGNRVATAIHTAALELMGNGGVPIWFSDQG